MEMQLHVLQGMRFWCMTSSYSKTSGFVRPHGKDVFSVTVLNGYEWTVD